MTAVRTGWRLGVLLGMVCGLLLYAFPTPVTQVVHAQVAPTLEVKASVLMEATTGQVLHALNEKQPYQPASMTKMMTEYILLEEIKAGRLKWDDDIVTSPYAAQVIGSGQLMAEGVAYKAKDVFDLLSIYSGNDASVAFAEHLAGTEEQFAKKMNEMAAKIGLSSASRFINSTGLSRKDMGTYAPASLPGETLLTAIDSALLAQRIVLDHPEVLETTKIPKLKFQGKSTVQMVNWNWMVEGNKANVNLRKFAYEGLDGLKTGHTSDAGYCFTATAQKNGMRLISVVIGANSIEGRFQETRKLLDYGFNQFEKRTVLAAKTTLDQVKTVFIKNGIVQHIPVVAGAGVQLLLPKDDAVTPTITVTWLPQEKLQAPLKAETIVGTIKVQSGALSKEVPLVTTEPVEEAGFFRKLWRGFVGFFASMMQGVMDLF